LATVSIERSRFGRHAVTINCEKRCFKDLSDRLEPAATEIHHSAVAHP
jgi:hypothetical protein